MTVSIIFAWIFIITIFATNSLGERAEESLLVSEFCQLETFQPICSGPNEVVLITTAVYGRMRVGKCITQEEVSGLHGQDPKYLGCSSDVIDTLHPICSLKSSCQIKIPDAALDKTKPCFPGLKMYLRAEYICINVVDQESDCRIQASTSITKYLTFQGLLSNPNCGVNSRSWIIEASRGQKVQLTLVTMQNKDEQISRTTCGYEIGSIFEKSMSGLNNRTVCSGGIFLPIQGQSGQASDEDKFVSSGSTVEINVKSNLKDYYNNDKKYHVMILIKIEASGCLDIIPPEDTWLKRNNDDIVIGCYSSKQTWYLRCENKRWIGNIGNCSSTNNADQIGNEMHDGVKALVEGVNEEHQILVIVAICGIGIVICSLIICVGAVCLKRFTKKQLPSNFCGKQPTYYLDGHYTMNGHSLMKSQQKTSCHDQENVSADALSGYDDVHQTNNKENNYFILEEDSK